MESLKYIIIITNDSDPERCHPEEGKGTKENIKTYMKSLDTVSGHFV